MSYEHKTPRPAVRCDEAQCGNAVLCLKCVKACLEEGYNCLGFINTSIPPIGEDAPRRLEDIEHRIVVTLMALCNGCGACVRACPKRALTLEMPEPGLPAARVQRSDVIYCATLKDGTKIYPRD